MLADPGAAGLVGERGCAGLAVLCRLHRPLLDGRFVSTGIPVGDADKDGLPASIEDALGCSDTNKDTDGDGIFDGVEVKGWGTSCASKDSDADGCEDWIEIVDVNGDGQANALDLNRILLMVVGLAPPHPALDINKDGVFNKLDHVLAVYNSTLFRPHSPCSIH